MREVDRLLAGGGGQGFSNVCMKSCSGRCVLGQKEAILVDATKAVTAPTKNEQHQTGDKCGMRVKNHLCVKMLSLCGHII